METWWQSDRIISAFIVGCFSMTAALISMFVNSRRIEAAARKAAEAVAGTKPAARAARRPVRRVRRLRGLQVGAMFVAGLVVGGVGYRFGATALSAAGMTLGLPFDGGWRTVPTLPPLVAAEPDARAASGAGAPRVGRGGIPAATASGLADWLRAIGPRIYYRYAERLPEACAGATTAHGSWAGGDAGEPVRCVDSAWLVFDVAGLVKAGKVAPNALYCLNFRDRAGRWAAHDAGDSPGIERVVVPSRTGALGAAPIGFRVIRQGGVDRIEFGSGGAPAPC
ncbi:MAG TPA: hypothetical protein VF158_04500 [Longimicrobiales bacterium]